MSGEHQKCTKAPALKTKRYDFVEVTQTVFQQHLDKGMIAQDCSRHLRPQHSWPQSERDDSKIRERPVKTVFAVTAIDGVCFWLTENQASNWPDTVRATSSKERN